MATLTFLSIATEWFSRKGGVSTFNRQLCQALAKDGHLVFCYLPTCDAEERADAASRSVNLVPADAIAGALPESALIRKPRFRDSTYPDVIIGHGRFTGPAAKTQKDDNFKRALRLHVVHTAPGELEFNKGEPTERTAQLSEEREDVELELASSADLVVAVGPLLYIEIKTGLLGRNSSAHVHQLNPGLQISSPAADVPPQQRCLMLGRAEDVSVKGLDVAARTVGLVHESGTSNDPILVVRGAPAGTGGFLRRELEVLSKAPGTLIRVKEYSAKASRISEDIRSASVMLMPSRTEGFGLVGLEAISMDVPVLLSHRSGLAQLLTAELKELAASSILPVSGDVEKDAEIWAASLERILINRVAAFEQARILRKALAESLTWEFAVKRLVREIGATRYSSPTSPFHNGELEPRLRTPTAKIDVDSLSKLITFTKSRAYGSLLSAEVKWGPSLFSSTPKVANVCEVLLALDEAVAIQRSPDLTEPIKWLLAQQRQGGFPSLSRDLVTTHCTALGGLVCARASKWSHLPKDLCERLSSAGEHAAEACLRMAGDRGWGTWGKGSVRIQPTIWALRALISQRQLSEPEIMRRFEVFRMLHSAGAPGCFGFKPGREARISPTASFLLLCADLDSIGYAPHSPDRYYLEKYNAAQYLLTSLKDRGGWSSEVELYYVDREYIQFVGNVEQFSWFHVAGPLAIEALCRNPELIGRGGFEGLWLERVYRMLADFDLTSGMIRDPVIIEAGLTEAVFPTAYACCALNGLTELIANYENIPEHPRAPVKEFTSKIINKVGAAIIDDGRILLARKFGTNKLIMPGGGIEPGENMEAALKRELFEELEVTKVDLELPAIGVYRAQAAFEPEMEVEITLYRTHIEGVPKPSGEIEELVWFGRNDDPAILSPIIKDLILPELERRDLFR
jgi:glycosyltransferase involved in cell wall biosynthesis/8-oxo-dGTP pyrophosphatase MutT (NUDIX family)